MLCLGALLRDKDCISSTYINLRRFTTHNYHDYAGSLPPHSQAQLSVGN